MTAASIVVSYVRRSFTAGGNAEGGNMLKAAED
jgi:hypothetical protein